MFFLGSISGASGSSFNSFAIPKGARYLYFTPSATGILFQMGAPGGNSSPSGTFQANPATATPLPVGPSTMGFRVPRVDGQVLVAIWNPTGGNVSVEVYGSPAS